MDIEQRKTTKIRGIVAVVFGVISIILYIAIIVDHFMSGSNALAKTANEAFLQGILVALIVGGIIPGFSHIDIIFDKLKVLLFIPVVGWMAFLLLVLLIPTFGGWLFMLVDLIKYLIMKKNDKKASVQAAPQYTQTTDVQ